MKDSETGRVVQSGEVRTMYDVVALGELLIDFTCRSTDEEGYPTMAAHPGGAPANFLAVLSRFGARTALLGKVGDDAFGRLLRGSLERAGIGTGGLLTDRDAFTTLAFVTLDGRGDREFSFARKPGADTRLAFEELDLKIIDRARVFHFGTLSLTDEPARTATHRAVEYARGAGKLISFDPNLRRPLWRDLEEARREMLWGLSMADVVKLSDEEVEFLFGLSPQAGAEQICAELGPKLVFVTCGAAGCRFRSARAEGYAPGLEGLKTVDTTGAGDIFGGSALWKFLQTGKGPEELEQGEVLEIARFANAAAGLSTTRFGGISSVPGLEEVLERLEG